jgi:D-3-phosphoglycerate dehydrogenase
MIRSKTLQQSFPKEKALVEDKILEPCYIRNGAIFAMTRECIVDWFSSHGKDCRPYLMPEQNCSVNIDTMIDFKLAEILLEERHAS